MLSPNLLRQESPGFVVLLTRAFGEDVIDVVSADYQCASAASGNQELHGLAREAGVSFRPRLARVGSILLQDLGCRDLLTVRAALYVGSGAEPKLNETESRLIQLVRTGHPSRVQPTDMPEAQAIALAIELDAVRHLHMTSLAEVQRQEVLASAKQLLERLPEVGSLAPLRTKLEHAIGLQRKRLERDSAAAEKGEALE